MNVTIEKTWTTEAGLTAEVIYIVELGHRCGYVQVPNDHPLYGTDYSDAPLEVHGDVTYGGPRRTGDDFWFGFDCAHYMDAPAPDSPMAKFSPRPGAIHRSLEFCVGECETLAAQLSTYRKP